MSEFDYLPDDIQITMDVIEPGIILTETNTITLNKTQFIEYIEKYNISIAGNGVMYRNDVVGIVPTILDNWFDDRNKFKRNMKEHEPDSDLYKFYDRKQLITKILLNSLYGVLLLPSFRLYDKQNGEAVTLSSQNIIKFSNFIINKYYQNKISSIDEDAVQYSDTDSNYIKSIPLWPNKHEVDEIEIYTNVQKISKDVCEYVNKSLIWLAEKHFNAKKCRLLFQEEKISKRAFWGQAKKRYAQLSVELVDGKLKEKIDIKGFDVVRSSFPKAFRKIMKEIIIDILHDIPIADLNAKVRAFNRVYKNSPIFDIMLPSGVKEISKFKKGQKGTPIHVKSAQNYNQLMGLFGIDSIPPISDGDKIIYAYVKQNPFGFETMALRGQGEDDVRLVEFMEKYIDKERVFETALMSKLNTIWEDLGWGSVQLTEDNNFF